MSNTQNQPSTEPTDIPAPPPSTPRKTSVFDFVPIILMCTFLFLATGGLGGLEMLIIFSPLWGIYALIQLIRCFSRPVKPIAIKLILLTITIGSIVYYRLNLDAQYREMGETVLARVEAFKQVHGHFPSSKEEISTLGLEAFAKKFQRRHVISYRYNKPKDLSQGDEYPFIFYRDINWLYSACYYKFEEKKWLCRFD